MFRAGGTAGFRGVVGARPVTLSASRAAALRILTEIRRRDAWSHDAIARMLPGLGLEERDSAHATRLVYGVLSCEGTLDDALDRYIDRPGRTHPKVRDALRVAAYELLFGGSVHAVAVDQGVEAVRAVHSRAASLANAVLRRLASDAPSFPWGDPDTDLDALSRLTAHPSWLARLLVNELGRPVARSMMEANNEPAPLFLAHNPFRGSMEDLVDELDRERVEARPFGPAGCLHAGRSAAAVRSRALREGRCIVTDAAAQFVATLAAPGPRGRAVELAAGRGTKTLVMQAASLLTGGVGEILSADLHEFKTALLARRMSDLGVPGVTVRTTDTTDPAVVDTLGGPGSADVVLVDAPCSGLGTLRRHPEKRWRLNPASIEQTAVIGEAMLLNAARLVRRGGFVVYSTCTVTKRENQQVVEEFLAGEGGRGFATASVANALPEGWEPSVTEQGWFRSLPAPGGPDGHFAAVLKTG